MTYALQPQYFLGASIFVDVSKGVILIFYYKYLSRLTEGTHSTCIVNLPFPFQLRWFILRHHTIQSSIYNQAPGIILYE